MPLVQGIAPTTGLDAMPVGLVMMETLSSSLISDGARLTFFAP
jgi:hypothetical protein